MVMLWFDTGQTPGTHKSCLLTHSCFIVGQKREEKKINDGFTSRHEDWENSFGQSRFKI